MGMLGVSARAIARSAGLTLIDSPHDGAVLEDGPVLEVGRGASENAIATVGYRRLLRLDGHTDERLVARVVRSGGFEYTGPPLRSCRDHKPPHHGP
jgi:hypothetical protein